MKMGRTEKEGEGRGEGGGRRGEGEVNGGKALRDCKHKLKCKDGNCGFCTKVTNAFLQQENFIKKLLKLNTFKPILKL